MPASSARLVTLAAYPRKLLRLFAEDWQIGPDALLAGSQLTLAQLDRADRLVPVIDVFVVFMNAQRLCPEPDLALRYARQLMPGTHGLLGTATLTAPDLRAVVALYYHFLAVAAPFVLLHQETRPGRQQVIIETITDIQVDEAFLMQLVTVAGFNIIASLLPERVREIMLHLTSAPPAWADALQAHCQRTVHFHASFNGLSIPDDLLDAPLPGGDAERHAVALAELNARMDTLLVRGSFIDAVRQYLRSHEAPLPRLGDAAAAFALSPRAFRNRLAQQGESFQGLLDDERRYLAERLLRDPEMSVKTVAWRLGFRESSNFSRVFKRWTGDTPMAWRERARR